jgi:hypothetical protein
VKRPAPPAAKPKRVQARALAPVEVEWEDAAQWTGWHPQPAPGDVLERLVIRSRGFLVQETRHQTVVAQSVASNGQLGDLLVIPRGWIRRVRRGR